MSGELSGKKKSIIRTVSITPEDDAFLKSNKGSVNFSNECRKLIAQLRKQVEGGASEE